MWTLDDAVALCRKIEEIAPRYGAHVALTGGCLYKDGDRKDVDIIFYRIRQTKRIQKQALFQDLEWSLGLVVDKHYGWVTKAKSRLGYDVDLFFPEDEKTSLWQRFKNVFAFENHSTYR